MKKVFLVLPLAIVLANCSSTRNTNGTASNSGTNASAGTTASSSVSSDASTSSTSSTSGSTASATGSMNNSSNTANWNSNNNSGSATAKRSSSKSSSSINWDVYDPNNYMQNPDKYRKPYEIAKAGGWTYNKDWRRNTNFTADAVGEWQLTITPEVASYWMPDTRRPETYASFWTPEAVMARYQARVAAILKTQDSLAAIEAANSGNVASTSNGNASTSATTSDNSATAANTTAVTGSGTTGAMGTGGSSSATTSTTSDSSASNSGVTTPFLLTAVNGNNYLLPKLNLYIDNGSFTAYTGCNNAVGKIIVDGSSLHFEETTPSSNVECIGGFDQSAFLDRLRRADSYDVVNNQFRIKQGDQVLMTFQKNAQKL